MEFSDALPAALHSPFTVRIETTLRCLKGVQGLGLGPQLMDTNFGPTGPQLHYRFASFHFDPHFQCQIAPFGSNLRTLKPGLSAWGISLPSTSWNRIAIILHLHGATGIGHTHCAAPEEGFQSIGRQWQKQFQAYTQACLKLPICLKQ